MARILLNTNADSMRNDICDVIRLFFPFAEFVEQEAHAYEIQHNMSTKNGTMVNNIAFYDKNRCLLSEYSYHKGYDASKGGMEIKKQLKRCVKISVYRCLQRHYKKELPWGCLTGIRPTSLARELGQEAQHIFLNEFDVSEDRFALTQSILQTQKPILSTINEKSLDVYIGIPFCKTRCLYCSFVTKAMDKKRTLVKPYLNALLKEISAFGPIVAAGGYHVRAIYIGGGTPTSLHCDELKELLQAVNTHFPQRLEFTVEAGRPDTLDKDKLLALKDAGVDRISINPQTLNDETLNIIGRSHSAREIAECFHTARLVGLDNINMDIIIGLPGENVGMVEHTLSQIKALDPEALTVHTLAIKRASSLKLNLSQHQLPNASAAAQMLDASRSAAQGMGMHPYYMYRQKNMTGSLENIGYAKPKHECIYNIDIMEEAVGILALGAGAITKRLFSGGRIERLANTKDIGQYVKNIDDIIRRKSNFTE